MAKRDDLAPKSMMDEISSSLLRTNKDRYHNILVKKQSMPMEDKAEVLCATIEDTIGETEIGYVNFSRFLYLMANIEDLHGSLRRKNAALRAKVQCGKLRGFDNKVARRLDVFSQQEFRGTKDRYSEVIDGLSRLALGPLTKLREVNRLKKVFTDALDKHRSTAFFNVIDGSRTLPNKFHVFNAVLNTTILNGAINKEEMGYLALISKYVNPYDWFFKTAGLYSSLYIKDGVSVHTELNAVCDIKYGEYYTLMEASKFMLLLRILCDNFCTTDKHTDLLVNTISDMCALFITTAAGETGGALGKLRPLVDVRFLTV